MVNLLSSVIQMAKKKSLGVLDLVILVSPDLDLARLFVEEDVMSLGLVGDPLESNAVSTNDDADFLAQVLRNIHLDMENVLLELRGRIVSLDGLPTEDPSVAFQETPVITRVLGDDLGRDNL